MGACPTFRSLVLLLAILPTLGLGACSNDQFLVIPRAEVCPKQKIGVDKTIPAPTWQVESGTLPSIIGDRSTINVALNPDWPFETAEILITVWITATLSYAEYWVYEVSDEERAAGQANVEVGFTEERPDEEVCLRSYTGRGTCYGRVNEGITSTGWLASDGAGTTSIGAGVPITLAPINPQSSPQGQCQTFQDCCGCIPDPNLGTNMRPIECYEKPACGCPSGTTDRGEGPQGFRACVCPNQGC